MSEYLFSMDTKNRSKNLDSVKYLHPFSPSPSHNGHRHNPGAEGKADFSSFIWIVKISPLFKGLFSPDYFDAADSAFKKIKLLQESSLEHHPTSVSCPTPARRRHRTTFTQVRFEILKKCISIGIKISFDHTGHPNKFCTQMWPENSKCQKGEKYVKAMQISLQFDEYFWHTTSKF